MTNLAQRLMWRYCGSILEHDLRTAIQTNAIDDDSCLEAFHLELVAQAGMSVALRKRKFHAMVFLTCGHGYYIVLHWSIAEF